VVRLRKSNQWQGSKREEMFFGGGGTDIMSQKNSIYFFCNFFDFGMRLEMLSTNLKKYNTFWNRHEIK